jgi:NitT/TauT family transport system ATP-binding protein
MERKMMRSLTAESEAVLREKSDADSGTNVAWPRLDEEPARLRSRFIEAGVEDKLVMQANEPKQESANPQIIMNGLGKVFGDFVALTDVTLRVEKGQFCCIVGPSGCGKTTLLRIVAGLEQHSSGQLEIFHYDQRKPRNSMIFQEQSIFPWMTVRENVAFGLRMRGRSNADADAIVDYYIEKVGLSVFRGSFPHQLSGGMKQRVSIARAFANDPEILLMDEPFAALDEQNKALLQEELLRIWEESKKTVLFITHSIDEAIVLSDRALIMTARPGTMKYDLSVSLPRPRHAFEMKSLPAYGELSGRLWQELRDEVVKAKTSEKIQ